MAKLSMTVRDYMTPSVVSVGEGATLEGVLDTLHALVKLMRRNAKDAFKGA